jgi:hypothetical protein
MTTISVIVLLVNVTESVEDSDVEARKLVGSGDGLDHRRPFIGTTTPKRPRSRL